MVTPMRSPRGPSRLEGVPSAAGREAHAGMVGALRSGQTPIKSILSILFSAATVRAPRSGRHITLEEQVAVGLTGPQPPVPG